MKPSEAMQCKWYPSHWVVHNPTGGDWENLIEAAAECGCVDIQGWYTFEGEAHTPDSEEFEVADTLQFTFHVSSMHAAVDAIQALWSYCAFPPSTWEHTVSDGVLVWKGQWHGYKIASELGLQRAARLGPKQEQDRNLWAFK